MNLWGKVPAVLTAVPEEPVFELIIAVEEFAAPAAADAQPRRGLTGRLPSPRASCSSAGSVVSKGNTAQPSSARKPMSWCALSPLWPDAHARPHRRGRWATAACRHSPPNAHRAWWWRGRPTPAAAPGRCAVPRPASAGA